ncbi:MAG TPA: hypothetical protein VGG03_22915 [Thermoanaerobaculia bacterium]|jgi:ELWxxDGT repeat protein
MNPDRLKAARSRRRRLACVLLLIGCLGAAPATGQTPALLVDDLVTEPAGEPSNPYPAAQLGEVAYFTADDGRHGVEIWRTDGTPGGTELLADLCPGSCSFSGSPMVVGDQLFAFGDVGAEAALFVSDGTGAGTRLVRRFPGASPRPQGAAAFGGRAWFVVAYGPPFRTELWQSDGTLSGTTPLALSCPDGCEVSTNFLVVAGGALYFVATSPTRGRELWLTDGTEAGTRPAIPDCFFGCVEVYSGAVVAGDRLYFLADDHRHGVEVWVAGADIPTPRMVADLNPGSDSSGPTPGGAIGGAAWFSAVSTPQVRSWFRFTPEGAVSADEVQPLGRQRSPLSVWEAGGRLYFVLYDYDGGTSQLWTVRPGVESARLLLGGIWYVAPLGEVGNLALLRVTTDATTRLYASDGTPEGTQKIGDFVPAFQSNAHHALLPPAGALVSLDDGVHGFEPWVTNGTTAGTRPLGDLRSRASGNPRSLAAAGDRLLYLAGPAATPRLLRAGGSPPATEEILLGGFLSDLTSAGGKGFLSRAVDLPGQGVSQRVVAVDPASGRAEMVYDGGSPFNLTPWGDRLAFSNFGGGQPLWTSDGTLAGTREVIDIHPGWSNECPILCAPGSWPRYPSDLTPVGPLLFFFGIPPSPSDEQLYATDGTLAGTRALLAPSPSEGYRAVEQLTPFGSRLAFLERRDPRLVSPATTLWLSDGTAAGTAAAFAPAGEPRLLGAIAGKLVYSLRAADVDTLWATDGTAAGNLRLSELGGAALRPRVTSWDRVGPARDRLEPPRVVGERLFFTVADDLAGEEPWVTDGTAGGTGRVADLLPGPQGSHPTGLRAYRACALFAASDGSSGYELWASDGATAWLVSDVAADGASSPGEISPAGAHVYFAADDGPHGRELFAVPAAALDSRCAAAPPSTPPPPAGDWLASPQVPGFRIKVLFGQGTAARSGSLAPCVAGTLCVNAVGSERRELLVRLGAAAGGRIAASVVKLDPAEAQVWIEQTATGELRYYRLAETPAGDDRLAGVRDLPGFPAKAALAAAASADRVAVAAAGGRGTGGRWLTPRSIPGFRFQVRLLDGAGRSQPVRVEACMPGALCLGAVGAGRAEVFVRLLDQGPLGLWPALARLTTAGVELWIQQLKTGVTRRYLLPAAAPDADALEGLLDREGFRR